MHINLLLRSIKVIHYCGRAAESLLIEHPEQVLYRVDSIKNVGATIFVK